MRDPLCELCRTDPAKFDLDALPTHMHCDGVILVPQRRFRRGQRAEYRGAWRAEELLVVVSRLPGRRTRWRAVVRGPGMWDLVTADGKRPSEAVRELESRIDALRCALAKGRQRW